MKVGDLMQVDIVSVRPDATIKETVSALATAHVTGLPVVNREGQMVGVISNSAIIAANIQGGQHRGKNKKCGVAKYQCRVTSGSV